MTLARTRVHLGSFLWAIVQLMRLDKPYGTLLLLWPTLWSLFLAARGRPSWMHLVIFVLGCLVMRSAGCVINDLADRHIDREVDRTRDRPLASGRLGVGTALGVLAGLLLLALGLLWWLPSICWWLSLVALALAGIYPFTKRFFHAPQLFLGMAFGWGAIMAWAAVWEEVEAPAVLIFLATVFWAAGYDTIYALMDWEDDRRIGVHSTALLFGTWVRPAVVLLFLLTTLCLVLVGSLAHLGGPYHLGVGMALAAFLYQGLRVSQTLPREQLFRYFKAHVWIGLIILVGIEVDFLWRGNHAI